jgi:predicted amidohydrolase
MNELRVSTVQTELFWQDEQANLLMLEAKLAPLAKQTDLIVLPEMFNSGFSMSPEKVAQPFEGTTLKWMKAQAKALDSAICGSIAVIVNGKYLNRFIFVHPDGTTHSYDKRHCFRMSGEHEVYSAGNSKVIVEYRGWRILTQICYDLRFPVFSRNQFDAEKDQHEYDLMINVANWPEPRRNPWRVLAQARAVENLAYVVAVNRVGQDDNGNQYSGDSLVVDYQGDLIFDHQRLSAVHTSRLDLQNLVRYRKKFPAWLDADHFTLNLL